MTASYHYYALLGRVDLCGLNKFQLAKINTP